MSTESNNPIYTVSDCGHNVKTVKINETTEEVTVTQVPRNTPIQITYTLETEGHERKSFTISDILSGKADRELSRESLRQKKEAKIPTDERGRKIYDYNSVVPPPDPVYYNKPKTRWDYVKEGLFPEWLKKHFPVQYIRERVN